MEWKAAATVRIRDIGNVRIRYAVLCWPSDHAHSQAIKLLYSVYIKNIQIGNSAPELPLLAHSGMKCTQCTRHTHTSLTHTHVLIFLVYLYLFIVWPKSGPSISKTSRPLAVSLTHYPPYFLFQCMCAAASATRRMGALLFWINKASLKLRAKIPSKRSHTYAFWRVFVFSLRVLCLSVCRWFVCLKRNICLMSYWPTLRLWANTRVMARPILDMHRWERRISSPCRAEMWRIIALEELVLGVVLLK